MDALLEHVSLMESLVVTGLARGRVDTEAMGLVLSAFHRPRSPLEPVPLHLPALLWAFDQLPEELGPQDTVWVVGEDVIDSARDRFVRLGPTEWAVSGGFQNLRQKALALATLSASSRQVREAAAGEETLGEIATELAYAKISEPTDRGVLATRLALTLGFDAAEFRGAVERQPSLLERIVRLSQSPQLQQLKTRGITRGRQTPRATALWRDLLQGLSSLDADHRPIIVWVAPLWVSDLVSPYVREVRPLLARWASESEALANLGALVQSGDEDAVYLCSNLVTSFNREVRDERDSADASVGIFSITDDDGAAMAKIVDCARLEANAVDPRVGDVAKLSGPAPIVLVFNEGDPDVGYAFSRLLAEVRAEFLGISVCFSAVGAPGVPAYVAGARAAQSISGTFVFAAPAHGGEQLRALGVPDLCYLELFGMKAGAESVDGAWYGHDRDAAFEEHRAQQDAFTAALWQGDLDAASISQRLWVDAEDDAEYLACKRAHIADAVAHWRAFLGVDAPVEAAPSPEQPEPDPEPPSKKPARALEPGSPRDMPNTTMRFRV